MKLEIKNLKKQYGKQAALNDLSITFEPGIYGILGANGAGKSTMMNLLTDNLKRDGGEILWNGTDILTLGQKFRGLLGYMPQQQGFYEHMTAQTFLYYMADLKGLPKRQAAAGDRQAAGYNQSFPCTAQKAGRLFGRHEAARPSGAGAFGRPEGGDTGRAYRWP